MQLEEGASLSSYLIPTINNTNMASMRTSEARAVQVRISAG
jgi:hypothetical protein